MDAASSVFSCGVNLRYCSKTCQLAISPLFYIVVLKECVRDCLEITLCICSNQNLGDFYTVCFFLFFCLFSFWSVYSCTAFLVMFINMTSSDYFEFWTHSMWIYIYLRRRCPLLHIIIIVQYFFLSFSIIIITIVIITIVIIMAFPIRFHG